MSRLKLLVESGKPPYRRGPARGWQSGRSGLLLEELRFGNVSVKYDNAPECLADRYFLTLATYRQRLVSWFSF